LHICLEPQSVDKTLEVVDELSAEALVEPTIQTLSLVRILVRIKDAIQNMAGEPVNKDEVSCWDKQEVEPIEIIP
jgi:hypothetical protein